MAGSARRVFLSHTSELRDHPAGGSFVDAAEKAVLRVRDAPVDMAHFTAGVLPPAALCRQRVADCDVYVLVAGFRYGSPVVGRPSLSYTELEFEAATELGKPRLVFLLDGKADWPDLLFQDPEFRDRQEAFRQRLLLDSGLTVKMVKTPAELDSAIVHALTELRVATPTGAEHPVPRQLLAAPSAFTGRASELAAMTAALDDSTAGTVVISALAGAGGIGKTALALHWAHACRTRFPDGQLFVDLRGFSPDSAPMTAGEAVRGFLAALGVAPGRVPDQAHAQFDLYRSLVADKRMLIVLDNAATAEQVKQLLPGDSQCTVVVTSRLALIELITGYGARHIRLDRLTDDESRDLLIKLLGQPRATSAPEALEKLLAYCGGFPLALSIVAGRVHIEPEASLQGLAMELDEVSTAMDFLSVGDASTNLPIVFSWSYQALSRQQQKMFALLGITPGPSTSMHAAASLGGVSLSEARVLLRALHKSSFVDVGADCRYTMHDLVRSYAVQRANEDLTTDERSTALRRALDFYVHTAYAADCLLNPYLPPVALEPVVPGTQQLRFPDREPAVAWFDVEHVNLLAAQRTAITCQWPHLVWQLAWSLGTFHSWRGHLDDRIQVWQAVLVGPTNRIDAPHGPAYRNLGRTYAELGEHDAAIQHLTSALTLAEQDQDLAEQGWAHRELA